MSETTDRAARLLIDATHEAIDRESADEDREPTDFEIYNGYGREGGIAYAPDDQPGSLGENDWRL